MKILGIETSCDETAVSVVENGQHILSNVVNSQIDIHAVYGGVVPEVAARSHIEVINPVINQALTDANLSWSEIDAIAVTYAPGLAGSLLIGSLAARTLAILKNKPLYPVHHVKAHVYANFLDTKSTPKFPLLALIVSGGHSQLVLFNSHTDFNILGQTQDDAIGEAFDKVAKIIGLPYPGGPSIAASALSGNPLAYQFPKAKLSGKYDFSFSGLKTAVLRAIQREVGVDFNFPSSKLSELLSDKQKHDFSASFQKIAVETLAEKALLAFHDFNPKSFVVAGGVASNLELRKTLSKLIPVEITYPPANLCTDNGAMVASLGYYESLAQSATDPYSLEVVPSLSMTSRLNA